MNVVEEPIFTRRNALLTAYPSESVTPESGYNQCYEGDFSSKNSKYGANKGKQ